MSTREPVIVDGELIGWNVTALPEYAEVEGIDGSIRERVMTRAGSRFFMPIDWKPGDKQ
jgi:hypothetical protein